ncbi:MAG TPA: hypothetical protein VMW20_07310 [Candidatus Nanoarchaeia archaeon]|nr:hypothetical protein [Candidatus Nanoarchaeia archaeon]
MAQGPFIVNPQRHPLWKQVVIDITQQFSAGQVVTHSWLKNQLKIVEPATGTKKQFNSLQIKYMYEVDRIREELLHIHQIYLHSEYQVGYRLLQPSEQTRVVWTKMVKSLRKALKQAHEGLINVRHNNLTTTEQKENSDKLAVLSQIETGAKKRIRNAP